MSVADNIARLTDIRNRQREKLAGMNLVDSTAKFEAITQALEGIEVHGAIYKEVQEDGSYTIPAGYHNGGGKVVGVAGGGNYKLAPVQEVTPKKSLQNISPTDYGNYYGLAGVTVLPIPPEFQDVTDVTAEAKQVLSGKVFVDSEGTVTAGTMPKIDAVTASFDGITTPSYTIPEGYHNGEGTVSLTNDIELALAAL